MSFSQENSTLEKDLISLALSYCHWLKKEAEAKGVSRLFFLARDSWPFFQHISNHQEVERSEPFESTFLYVSRRVLHVLNFNNQDPAKRSEFLRSFERMNPEKLVGRFPTTHAENSQILSTVKSTQEVFQNQRVIEILSAAVDRHKSLLEKYLAQAGVFSAENVGLVDLGWRGSSQLVIQALRSERGINQSCYGFYMGALPSSLHSSDRSSFLFDEKNFGARAYLGPRLIPLLESVFTAPFGMTIGYEQKNNGEVSPVLEDDPLSQQREEPISELIRQMNSIETPKVFNIVELKEKISKSFNNPGPEELNRFATVRYSPEIHTASQPELAPKLNILEMLRASFSLRLLQPGRKTFWLEASVNRSSKGQKQFGVLLCLARRFLLSLLHGMSKAFPFLKRLVNKRA